MVATSRSGTINKELTFGRSPRDDGTQLAGKGRRLGAASLSFSPMAKAWQRPSVANATSGTSAPGPTAQLLPASGPTFGRPAPAFSPDGRVMAAVNAVQIITLYDVDGGKALATLTPADPQSLCVPCFSPDGGQLAVGARTTPSRSGTCAIRDELRALESTGNYRRMPLGKTSWQTDPLCWWPMARSRRSASLRSPTMSIAYAIEACDFTGRNNGAIANNSPVSRNRWLHRIGALRGHV